MTSDFVTIDTKTNEQRKRREDKYWEAQWHIDALYHELQRGVERKPGGDYYGAYG
jgi:hypothetical protein